MKIKTLFLMIEVPEPAQEIFTAVNDGDPEQVKALLKEDRNLVHLTDNRINTPLHQAEAAGYEEPAVFLNWQQAGEHCTGIANIIVDDIFPAVR